MLKNIAILSTFYTILIAIAVYSKHSQIGMIAVIVAPSVAIVYAIVTSTVLKAGHAAINFFERKTK